MYQDAWCGNGYACVPAMILGIADLKRFSPGNSADQDLIQKMKGYEDSARDIIKTAEKWKQQGNGLKLSDIVLVCGNMY